MDSAQVFGVGFQSGEQLNSIDKIPMSGDKVGLETLQEKWSRTNKLIWKTKCSDLWDSLTMKLSP